MHQKSPLLWLFKLCSIISTFNNVDSHKNGESKPERWLLNVGWWQVCWLSKWVEGIKATMSTTTPETSSYSMATILSCPSVCSYKFWSIEEDYMPKDDDILSFVHIPVVQFLFYTIGLCCGATYNDWLRWLYLYLSSFEPMLLHLCKSFIYLDLEFSLAVTNALLCWQGEFVDGLIIVDILGN